MKAILTSGLLSITGAGLYSLNSINLPVYYTGSKFQRMGYEGKIGELVTPLTFTLKERLKLSSDQRSRSSQGSVSHARILRNKLMQEYFVDLSFQTFDTRKVRSLQEIKRNSDLSRYELSALLVTELEATGTRARLVRVVSKDISKDFWLSNRELIEVYNETTDRWMMYDPYFDTFVLRKKKYLSSAEFFEAIRAVDKSLEFDSNKISNAQEYCEQFDQNASGLLLQIKYNVGKRENSFLILTDDDRLMLSGESSSKYVFTNNISQFESIGI